LCHLRASRFGGRASVVLLRSYVIIEEIWVRFAKYHRAIAYLRPFPFVDFFRRTLGAPPFSSMNSSKPLHVIIEEFGFVLPNGSALFPLLAASGFRRAPAGHRFHQ
jgi:hypothetical protein